MFKLRDKGKKPMPRFVPPIPLQKPEKKTLDTGEYHTYKLHNNSMSTKSPTYKLSVPYFSTGTCKEYMKFCTNFDKVCTGQNITNGPGQFTLTRCLLEGEALTEFKNHN